MSIHANKWKYACDRERAEIEFSENGRTMKVYWEVATDGSTWRPLCELIATWV